MTLLTTLAVTERFRKSSKFLANNFALADPEDNINRLSSIGC